MYNLAHPGSPHHGGTGACPSDLWLTLGLQVSGASCSGPRGLSADPGWRPDLRPDSGLHAGQLTHGASSGSLPAPLAAPGPPLRPRPRPRRPVLSSGQHLTSGAGADPRGAPSGSSAEARLPVGLGCAQGPAVGGRGAVTVTPLCTPTRSPRGRHWHWPGCAHSGWHWQPDSEAAGKWPRRRLLGPLNAYRRPLAWRVAGPGRVPHWPAERA
jgi:hypothetical protein